MININISDKRGFRLVKVEIFGGMPTPSEFATAVNKIAGQLRGTKPVLIDGRNGPSWGYCMLVSAASSASAVAVYDLRQPGYVVVTTRSFLYQMGQVIPELEEA